MKKISGLMPLVVLLAFSACVMPGQREDEDMSSTTVSASPSSGTDASYLPSLQTSPELRIKDLPIPAGYKYVPARSMILEYGAVQAGILTYEGTADAGDLISFFRKEMPKSDWSMSSMLEREEIKMLFEKQGRTCEVTVKPATTLSKKTIITIYYAPKE